MRAGAARSALPACSRVEPPLLQRTCACGAQPKGGACTECAAGRSVLQRSTRGLGEAAAAPSVVHDVLRSPGRPLDAATRELLEPRFGRDFSAVRVHSDSNAAESARSVSALAYTVG